MHFTSDDKPDKPFNASKMKKGEERGRVSGGVRSAGNTWAENMMMGEGNTWISWCAIYRVRPLNALHRSRTWAGTWPGTRRRRAPPRTRTFLLPPSPPLLLTACVITGDGAVTAASTVPGTWRLVTSWARPRGGALFVPFRRDHRLVLNSGSHGLPCPCLVFFFGYDLREWLSRLFK